MCWMKQMWPTSNTSPVRIGHKTKAKCRSSVWSTPYWFFIGINRAHSSQELLIKCTWWTFDSPFVWRIYLCVFPVPREKDITNDLREAVVSASQSGSGYKAISKQFEFNHSMRNLFTCEKYWRQFTFFPGRCPRKLNPRSDC